MKKSILTLAVLLVASLSFAQINVVTNPKSSKAIESAQWEVNDVVFKLKKAVESPLSKEAYAIVEGGEKTMRIPLFYNGDNSWVLRYSASIIGEKSFVIESEIKALDGKKGKFLITENTKEDRHGGIVLNDENPHHFFYEDGEHYANLAFECDWLFALDYGMEDLSKTENILNHIADNGFDQIVMNVYSHDVSWPKDEKLADFPQYEYGGRQDIFPFLGSNEEPDFSSLNIEFFQHFDRVIAAMHDKEIVSHLMIYVWNKLVAWPDMDTDADNMYYDYVVKRYQAFPNIVWDVSKEALFYKRATTEYIRERVERTRDMDAYGRLVSVHDYGFCKKNADIVDFLSMQNWQANLYQKMLDARNEFPKKPIFNIEHGGYEYSPIRVFPGGYEGAEYCLRRNYFCLFAGGYTTYYWQGASWNVVIHDPENLPKEEQPHFEYFKHMRGFMKEINFENCVPHWWSNSTGYNLTNKKDGIVAVYAPKEANWVSSVNALKKLFDYDNATQQWFNTLTGEYTEEKAFNKKEYDMWSARPFAGEADAIMIIKGLELKEEEK